MNRTTGCDTTRCRYGGRTSTRVLPLVAVCLLLIGPGVQAALGKTFYVSRLGDDSDGSSWVKAYRSIQKALSAIPDDKGGHRIIVRPDTYMEANLHTAHKGAKGAYNVVMADFDGSLGSGRTGYAVIDSSDPTKGFKSYDWYGTIRSYKKGWSKAHKAESFSAICWDRWHLRHLYATGGDGGLFFDGVDNVEPFSVLVEDCVAIGRAFGGGVASVLSRLDEPITFRRCYLWCLDWWGDAAGAYIRVENKQMSPTPDAIFEDCTIVGPDNALKSGNPGFSTYSRIGVKGCRLISLNFSQPHGKPGTGVIQSMITGKSLHVDLADTTVMGYKVFGSGKATDKKDGGPVGYTTKGSVRAYVQFQQAVPKGFTRLPHWPVEAFADLTPPTTPPIGPKLTKQDCVRGHMCEVTPVVWQGKLCLLECWRKEEHTDRAERYLTITDLESGKRVARFGGGYGLGCAIVHDDTFYVFASRNVDHKWNDVTVFWSKDLKSWRHKVVIKQANEHLFNSSVCRGPDGFVMAYESSDGRWPAFTAKFATSKDLLEWTKLEGVAFGKDRYAACPCIRYVDGWYYMMYLERHPPRWYFETYLVRSKDLRTWEHSPCNPVIAPTLDDEGINTSDVDLITWQGKTIIYYTTGDQRTWMNLKQATFDGSMKELFEGFFPAGACPISR